jgi:hypothetical protein
LPGRHLFPIDVILRRERHRPLAEFLWRGSIIDDVRLGYYSGKRADFIVVGDWYQMWHDAAAGKSPEIHRFIERRLSQEYIEVFRNRMYAVYSRL